MDELKKGLLYPAMQKFYSALKSLEQFEKGKNFFDNISYLDSFFSEYRNITFVLQKSLAHTDYNDNYQQLRDKFLVNDTSKWFVDKRNEVLKQQPFDLEKKIIITVYSGKTSVAVLEKNFTIENDIEYSTIIDSLRMFFVNINPIEVFFSTEFSFYERGQTRELYESLISGINHMKLFIAAVKDAVNEECTLCDQLEQRINRMNFYRVPKNMLFVDDYVYYCQKDLFEKGSRVELTIETPSQRIPISRLSTMVSNGREEDAFYNFVIMHLTFFKMQRKLMPTCMIVYDDDTFEFKSFDSSIKTTIYRKFHEISGLIESNKIVKVFFVTELLTYSKNSNNYNELLKMSSKERASHNTSEMLGFFMLDQYLSFKTFYFDLEKIDDMSHIVSVLTNPVTYPPEILFLNSVRNEFVRLSKTSRQ